MNKKIVIISGAAAFIIAVIAGAVVYFYNQVIDDPRVALLRAVNRTLEEVKTPDSSLFDLYIRLMEGAWRREVTLGLQSETMVEIIRGLDLGDRVVTAGQNFLSDGDPVNIVE